MKASHYEIFCVLLLYPFRPWYLPQHPVLTYPQPVSFFFERVQYNTKENEMFKFSVFSMFRFLGS
jgi:hypothetical protein